MFQELENPYLIKLRTILQSKVFYIILLLFLFAYVLVCTKFIPKASIYSGNETQFLAKILDYNLDGNKLALTVKTDKNEKLKATYYIETEKEKRELEKTIRYGITVRLNGNLEKPMHNTIPNAFDYKEYLYNNHIYYLLQVENILFVKEENVFYKIKNWIISYIKQIKYESSYLLAFIMGNKNELNEDIYKMYRENGVTHLFAISGMHIGLFTLILCKLCKKVGLNERKTHVFLGIFLFFYAFLTGFSASIQRAGLFFMLSAINRLFQLKLRTIYIFYVTIACLLLIEPFLLYNISFQYSVVTCFGIVYCSSYLKEGNLLWNALKLSFIAFLFSFPITFHHFYEINLFSIINNLYYIPWITYVVYPASLLTCLLPFLSIGLHYLILFTESCTNFLSTYLVFTIVGSMQLWQLCLYYLLLLVSLSKNRLCFLFLFLEIVLIKIYPYFDSNGYVYFLDVGQGDAALIISPYRKDIILIDTGGKIEYKKEEWEKQVKTSSSSDSLITFFKSIGITYINQTILSHGDMDHCGEFLHIAKEMRIENVTLNKGNYNIMETEILKLNIPNQYIYSKQIKITSLNTKVYNDENENSQVHLVQIYNTGILFMGDASKKVELDILEMYPNLQADMIKLGHHGSKTSSDETYLNTVKPKNVIISSGRNNRYNHPSKETLLILDELNIPYFNTQEKGTIKVIISRKRYTFSFYEP